LPLFTELPRIPLLGNPDLSCVALGVLRVDDRIHRTFFTGGRLPFLTIRGKPVSAYPVLGNSRHERAGAINPITNKYCADVLSPSVPYHATLDVSLLYTNVN
jgi:hypothetical protein